MWLISSSLFGLKSTVAEMPWTLSIAGPYMSPV